MSDSRTPTLAAVALIGVVCGAGALYASALDRVPIHLHHDEIYFGLIAESVASTLRDPQGRLLPVLFQMGESHHWYPPLLPYFNALWLSVLPLTDVTARLPNAAIGVANVLIMYFVARRMFANRAAGLAASAMLALTPAHFINSRIATDSLYPVLFILLWLLLLLRYLERPSARRLGAATVVLGIGVYGYIASVVMMPLYLVVTVGVLLWERRSVSESVCPVIIAVTAFALPLAFGISFILGHPEVIGNYAEKYQLASAGPQLNAFQQLREFLTPWNISDHLNLLHSSFGPGYLFVTGGSHLAHSTRMAGVFLAPMAVLLLLGLIDAIRHPATVKTVVVAGFLTAPLAATLVPEEYAIPRMLGLLPFGVLLATMGLTRLWHASVGYSPLVIATLVGSSLTISGLGYAAWMLVRHAVVSGSALLMAITGVVVWYVGRECDRRRDWTPAAVLVLALMPGQFVMFAADYFGDYRARSAAPYEYNIRGALEQAIAIHDRRPDARVYINDDILFVRAYWDFYLRVHNRWNIRDRANWFNSENGLPADMTTGSVVITNISEHALQRISANARLVHVATATDPVPGSVPPAERPTFAIFQLQ